MSDPGPEQEPKPQPEWSGGPPRPPKLTARDLEDGSPGDSPFMKLLDAAGKTKRLLGLLGSFEGSQSASANTLETELDERVIEFGNLLPLLEPLYREYAVYRLQAVRRYRRRHPDVEPADPKLRARAQKILDKLT